MKKRSWALAEALTLIREIQPSVMELGYYMAVAGGVLNNGFSENDLDLVMVPMTWLADPTNLLKYLEFTFGTPEPTTGLLSADQLPGGYHRRYPNKGIEVFFVEHRYMP